MSQPFYFLPNLEAKDLVRSQRLDRGVLAAYGLAEVFSDVVHAGEVAIQDWLKLGPGKQSGVFLCPLAHTPDRHVPPHFGYFPDVNRHEPRTSLPRSAWICWNPSSPPTPEHLRRRRLVAGPRLELAGGQQWQVPIVRRPNDSTELPRDQVFAADGITLQEQVLEEYQEVFEDLRLACLWLLNRDKPEQEIGYSREKALDLAIRTLGVNYRYGRAEHRVIRAINSTNVVEVLAAAVDWVRYVAISEAAKKKPPASASPSTTPGSSAGSPDTGPATPS